MSDLTALTVAVLGGTGPQGRGLARRWAAAGIPVVIGSRTVQRAVEAAAALADGHGWDGQRSSQRRRRRRGRHRRRRRALGGPCRAAPGARPGAARQGRGRLREPARLRQAGRVRPPGPGGVGRPAGRGHPGRVHRGGSLPPPERGAPGGPGGGQHRLATCWSSGRTGRPPTSCSGSRTRSPVPEGCTPVGCATPTRSRP